MRHARRVLITALLCLAVGDSVAAQPRPAEDAMVAARAFVNASGAAAQFDQVMPLLADQLSKAFRSLAPNRAREIDESMTEVVKRFTTAHRRRDRQRNAPRTEKARHRFVRGSDG